MPEDPVDKGESARADIRLSVLFWVYARLSSPSLNYRHLPVLICCTLYKEAAEFG